MAALSALGITGGPGALGALGLGQTSALDPKAKARASAVDFEAVFLNSMFGQMFTAMDGDGPLGGSGAVGVWRSFLSEQYAQSFAKAGGIGIADQVYRSLLAQQEVVPS
jgi:Rod binding domain-containing protein